MHLWQGGRELQASQSFLLLDRDGADLPEENERIKHLVIDDTIGPMSSAEVRNIASKGAPIGHLVCRSVCDYIAENQLYSG